MHVSCVTVTRPDSTNERKLDTIAILGALRCTQIDLEVWLRKLDRGLVVVLLGQRLTEHPLVYLHDALIGLRVSVLKHPYAKPSPTKPICWSRPSPIPYFY